MVVCFVFVLLRLNRVAVAFWLGPKKHMHKTHRWTVFVRGPRNEDLSYMLRSVEFHLHESFGDRATRVVSAPPYEVTEVGWGEFEVRMVLNFVDPNEESVTLLHTLRLHSLDGR
jgi:YEATS domain-containing protein 4